MTTDADGFPTRATEMFPASDANDLYVAELTAAVSGDRLYDPSFALARDPQAWVKMRRDADFETLIQLRRRIFASAETNIEPGGSRPEDVAVASLFEQALEELSNFRKARYNLADAVFRGRHYAIIRGEVRNLNLTIPGPSQQAIETGDIDWWVPTMLDDLGRERVIYKRPDNQKDSDHVAHVWSVARRKWEPLDSPELIVTHSYEDAEETLGYGRGILDALWFSWYAIQILRREGLQGVTRWAQGMLHAKVDGLRDAGTGKTNQVLATNVLTLLAKTLSRNVAVWDKSDEVETVSWDGKGADLVLAFKEDLLRGCYRLVVGALLPYGMAIDVGSNARAEQEQESSDNYLQFDYDSMGEDLTAALVPIWMQTNWPNLTYLGLEKARPPKIKMGRVQRHDPAEQANIATTLLSAGIALRKDEVYEKVGYTQPMADDDVFGDLAIPNQALVNAPEVPGLDPLAPDPNLPPADGTELPVDAGVPI